MTKTRGPNSYYILLLVSASILISSVVAMPNNTAFADMIIDKIPIGEQIQAIAVNSNINRIYAVNGGNTISIIDGNTHNVERIEIDPHAGNIAVNPTTSMIYVVQQDTSSAFDDEGFVTVIDGISNTVVSKIQVGINPLDVAVNPTTNRIYVTDQSTQSVFVIDGYTNSIITSIPVGYVYGIDVNPNTNTIYAVCNCPSGHVSVIDGQTNTVVAGILITPSYSAYDVAVNPDTNKIYVTWRYNVAVIDGQTNTVVAGIGPTTPSDSIAVNPATNKIYIDHRTCLCLSIVNGSTNNIISQLPISVVEGIGVNKNTNRVYVANGPDDTIVVLGEETTSAPSAPTGLSAIAISTSQINLSWTAPSDNGGSPVTGYQIERSSDNGSTWNVLVSNTGSELTEYADTGLASSTTYTYRVSAINAVGTSPPSNSASTTTFDPVPSSPSIQLGNQLPEGIEVNPNTNKIYVSSPARLASSCCPPNDKLFVIDGSNDSILVNVTVGWDSHNVAVNPNTNMIYVPGRDSSCRSCTPSNSSIHVIDGATNEVVSKVGVDGNLWGIGVNPNTNKVYVSNTDFDSVHIIDGTTNSIFDTISLESEPRGIAINPNTNKIYVALAPINKTAVMDGSTNSVIATIPVGDMPLDIAINPNTNKIYVANYGSRSCSIVSCPDPSSIGSTVSVIDGSTNSVTNTIQVGRGPYAITVDPSTSIVYVTNYFDNTISIIDGNTNSVVDTVPVGNVPNGVGVNPNTNKVYVSNYADRSVTVIDSSTLATLSIDTVDKLGNPLEGIWMQLVSADGIIIDAGFTPISFEVIQGEQYTVLANNYNQHVFLHWEDGDMDSSRDVTPTTDISMTATYTITTADQIVR